MGWKSEDDFETIHNYIGQDNIIRKGAISCYKGEKILIPLNMADGSLICIGKGNSDWNNSAPHGAGRALSRTQILLIGLEMNSDFIRQWLLVQGIIRATSQNLNWVT